MDSNWTARRAWLPELTRPVPETARTPAEVAAFELSQSACGIMPEVLPEMGESWRLTDNRLQGGPTGVLYGAYSLLRGERPAGLQRPFCSLRMLDCWDNMDGTIERGYSGRSIWFEGGRFRYEPARIRQLGRMLASVGINVLCLNNVNVREPAQQLMDEQLPDLAAFAALLRPFGVRVMLSVDFSSPLRHGLSSADPLDPQVEAWWVGQADRLWQAVPDLAGYLVKADSEHQPGPATYGRNHAQGANMLARSVKPHGGAVVWRAFVYNCMQDWRDHSVDRPCAAYDLYQPMDGSFDDNVILQIKNGPYDFQVREPVSPLLLSMRHTHMALEVQLAQEYTGHQIDLYAMPPLWREVISQLDPARIYAVAAVSNLGRDDNWTGHPFAALNLFAFGCFAWNPAADPAEVIRDWIRCSYRLPPDQTDTLLSLLLHSREAYALYTAPLGLCWMVNPRDHYGPSPYGYEFDLWGTYNRADRDAVGIDRTAAGTGYAGQYPPELAARFSDPQTCPETLLLFFHRLPYSWRMRDGRTLIQRIYDDHFAGVEAVEGMAQALETLSALPPADLEEAQARMALQLRNAREWRDVVNTFFHRLSGAPDAHGRKIYD